MIRVGSDSPRESLLRLAIVRSGLPEPELNVEYEGASHNEEAQIVRDIARSERYGELGWTEVRISKRHMVNDAKPAVAKVRTALIQAGWRPERRPLKRLLRNCRSEWSKRQLRSNR